MEKIENLFQNKNLEEILAKIPQLIDFQKFYEQVKYLKGFDEAANHEQFLYEIYEPTLKIAGTSSRAFQDFTKENYDTFSRLKWRWLNSAIANKPPAEESKNDKLKEEVKQPALAPQEISNVVDLVQRMQTKIAQLT